VLVAGTGSARTQADCRCQQDRDHSLAMAAPWP
jgi:hypothetical protein